MERLNAHGKARSARKGPMLNVGDPAPDLELVRADGQPTRLSDFWARGPVVLVFLRHYG